VKAQRFGADWLALREPSDAAARSAALAEAAARAVGPARPLVVHDLGCGTGSMGRWLSPRLPGPQAWVLHDHDAELAATAARSLPVPATVAVGDLADLRPHDLDGAGLVTASALLDVLTAAELEGVVAACAALRCPALLTLSVLGRVEFDPPDPLDAHVAAAFDRHQRRVVEGQEGARRLLGPDAAGAAVRAFVALGAETTVRRSPWRLRPSEAALATTWFEGWVGAAAEEEPALPVAGYRAARLGAIAAGAVSVTVHHADLLATWPGEDRESREDRVEWED
jgi:hypothetical protein